MFEFTCPECHKGSGLRVGGNVPMPKDVTDKDAPFKTCGNCGFGATLNRWDLVPSPAEPR